MLLSLYFLLLLFFIFTITHVMCLMFVQRFEPRGRRFTHFPYYLFRHLFVFSFFTPPPPSCLVCLFLSSTHPQVILRCRESVKIQLLTSSLMISLLSSPSLSPPLSLCLSVCLSFSVPVPVCLCLPRPLSLSSAPNLFTLAFSLSVCLSVSLVLPLKGAVGLFN